MPVNAAVAPVDVQILCIFVQLELFVVGDPTYIRTVTGVYFLVRDSIILLGSAMPLGMCHLHRSWWCAKKGER